MRWSVKVALVAATISLSRESHAATITLHEPDASGRVFVDVVGELNIGDEKTFETKTASRRNVIVTLISPGGNPWPAMEMGKSIRKHAMTTFVPGNRMCASACALIWLAGKPRTLESNARVGFHAASDRSTGRESGAGNALVGAYLNELGLSAKAIFAMTSAGPTEMAWLTDDRAKAWGLTMETMQPPRTIPVPAQPALQATPRVPPSPASPSSPTSPQGRPQIRAVVGTILGMGLPLNRDRPFSSTIMVIPEKAVVTIEDSCRVRMFGAPWCLVSYQGKLGYVNGLYLRILTDGPAPQPQAKRARTSTSLNLRTAPGRDSDIVRAMPTNSEVTVGGCRRMDDGKTWCEVVHEGTSGWVNAAFLNGASE
ncbi:MAG: SH3 domain-containing protein [Xanthobacteraceae bacterium]